MSERRSFNIGDVILGGFKICGDRWKPLLKVTALTVLPAAIFGALLIATYTPDVLLDVMSDPAMDPDATDAAVRAITSSEWVNLGLAFAVYLVIVTIANVIALNGCLHISLRHHEGEEMSHSDALRAGVSKMWPMLWLVLLSGLLTLVGLLFLIAPGIWLFVSWSVAPVILLREEARGTKAMKRSFGMVRSSFWPVFGVLLLEFACLFVLQAITGVFPNLLLPSAAEANSFAVFFTLSVGGALVGIFAVALHAAISTELYFALTPPEAANPPPPPYPSGGPES